MIKFKNLSHLWRNPFMAIFVISLLIGCLAALATVALFNIQPYVSLMDWASTEIDWVMEISWLSWLVSRLDIGIQYIGATFIWFVVQAFQCIWILVGLDVVANVNAAKKAIQIKTDTHGYGDSEKLAQIPFFFVKWAKLLAIGAYAFDLVIGLRQYPIWASWQVFLMWVKSLNPIWINAGNIVNLLLMLFCFEGVLALVIVVWQWLTTRNEIPAAKTNL